MNFHWNCYFSYIFQSILLKLGTLVSWVSPQTLFFSEFWNLDILIFYEFSLKLLLLLHFSIDSFETRYTCFLGQSPNFVLFRILKFGFSDFLWIFIKFSLKSLLLLQFPVDSLEPMYTYSLVQSSHLLRRFWPNLIHPSFIQIATAPTIFNGFLWNSHGEDGLSCRPSLKFSGAI